MWVLVRDVSWRRACRAPLRSLLVVFGIALGVSIWSAVLATNRSLVDAFEELVEKVSGPSDLTVSGGSSGIPDTLVSELAESDDIAHLTGTVEVITHTNDNKGGPILVLGVDFLGDPFFLPWSRTNGAGVVDDPLAFVNDPSAILLTTTLAAERGLKIGDRFSLVTAAADETFQVRGLIEPTGPAAVFAGSVAVMFRDAAQVRFGRGQMVDRIDIAVRPGRSVGRVEARLKKALSGRATVDRPSGRTERFATSLDAFRNGLNLGAAVSMLVGMFLIYNAVSISVAQRRREIGIVRSLGASKRTVVGLFCQEAVLMSIFGIGLGLVLAQKLSAVALANVESTISEIVLPIRPRPPVISPWIAGSGALVGMLVTLFAAYLPARLASRVEPAEAVRSARGQAAASPPPVPKLAGWGLALTISSFGVAFMGGALSGYVGITMLAAGMTLLVPTCIVLLRRLLVRGVEAHLGIPGRLALDNVERSLGRSTITVAGLMLAVGMSVSLAAFAGSFERSLLQWADDAFPADATITKGAPMVNRHSMPFVRSVVEPLDGTPGLVATNFVRLTHQTVRGRRVQCAAADTRVDFEQARRKGRLRQVLAGPRVLETNALYEAPRALISENMANRLKLAPGDALRIATHTGEKTFEVYAVVVDYSGDQGWMLIDQHWYENYWSDQSVDSAQLHFAPGSDEAAVLREIRARLGQAGGLFVTSHRELREQQRHVARNAFAVAQAPQVIAFLVAMMGVLGTVLSNVLDRIPEIGVLRAIGATSAQVLASVLAESGFLGMSAVVCGVLSGIPQGFILLHVISRHENGWTFPYSFPAESCLRIGLLIVAAAVCAGLLPARRASNVDVRTALSYE